MVRSHTVHVYDEGKPDGAAYHLETTPREGARIEDYTGDVEVRVTKTGYSTPIGGTSGWTLRAETSVTTDAVTGGANLTSTINYDAAGRAVESRRPGSGGTEAGTVKTVFYTAGANPDDAACGNRPERAGNPYGDDSDEPRWIIEDTTQNSLTRNVSGPDGDLVATTSATGDVELQFVNLHGDVSVTLDTAMTAPKVLLYDEFGVPTDGQAPQRYGWLGAKQRSGEALDGVILMGARLYSP